MLNYTCPICGYGYLKSPPDQFTICPSCGTEFGYDDFQFSPSELRQRWIENGMRWWSESDPVPNGWNPIQQLQHIAGFIQAVQETTAVQNRDLTINRLIVGVSKQGEIRLAGKLVHVGLQNSSSVGIGYASLSG